MTEADDPTTAYALAVVRRELPAGPIVRDACARHLRDLKAGKWTWNVEKAARGINFFPDVLRLVGGAHEGQPFELLPWQQFCVGSIMGWTDAAGWRRFRTGYIEGGKGSGKTPLAAGMALMFEFADDEPRAEIYAAAATKDQADVAFKTAVAMVRQSPSLSKRVRFSGGPGREYNMAHLESGSFFRKVAADSPNSGYLVHFALVDEVHEHKTSSVVDMMEAGQKGRRQPFMLMITNSGSSRIGPCYYNHKYAVKVCSNALQDDRFFAYVCAIDELDDPFKSEDCWEKANPSLGHTITVEYLRDCVSKARGMPSKEALIRRLNFCEWTDAVTPWIDRDLWESCQVPFDPEDCIGLPCWLGLDLSKTRDLTALSAVWRDENGTFWCHSWFWTPGDTLEERERADSAPYSQWKKEGHLFADPGRIVDKTKVAVFIQAICAKHDVRGMAYDNALMADLLEKFDFIGLESWIDERERDEDGDYLEPEEDGLRLVRHGQGQTGHNSQTVLWMPRSINNFEECIVNGTIGFNPNPVLNWNSSSAVLKTSENGNRQWDKSKSTGRIDGMISASQAVGLAMTDKVDSDAGAYSDPMVF